MSKILNLNCEKLCSICFHFQRFVYKVNITMELEVNLQFVKFGPHPSSNSIYDINNGETNKIVVRQFKGEHEPNEECHFLIPTLESDRIDGNWKTVDKQSPGQLYGHASLRSTRQVVCVSLWQKHVLGFLSLCHMWQVKQKPRKKANNFCYRRATVHRSPKISPCSTWFLWLLLSNSSLQSHESDIWKARSSYNVHPCTCHKESFRRNLKTG